MAMIFLCGCGRRWEQFWGQDTRPEPRYVELKPNQRQVEVVGDLFYIMAGQEFSKARYISVWAVDAAGVGVPLPYYDPKSGKTAMVVRDIKKPEYGPQLIWFVWVRTALPGATSVLIEYVQ